MKKIFIGILISIIGSVNASADITPERDRELELELQREAYICRQKCPKDVGFGVTLETVLFHDDEFEYVYLIQDVNEESRRNKEDEKDRIRHGFLSTPQGRQFIANLAEKGASLVYYYHTSAGEGYTLTFPPEELASFLQ